MDLTDHEYLILHPDPAVGKVLRGILREAGVQSIRVLADGRETLEAVRNDKGDLLLVDERLCGPQNWPFVREMKQIVRKRPSPVAIMMTAVPTRQLLEDALREGYVSVIAVPFSVRTFAAHVGRALGRNRDSQSDLADTYLLD